MVYIHLNNKLTKPKEEKDMRKGLLKKLLAVAIATTCVVSSFGCGGTSDGSSGGNATYKDTINIAVAQEAATLDIAKQGGLIAKQIVNGTIYEKLLTLNSKGEPTPELCESYTVSDDATEFTFILRKGVKFHDGSVMTVDDVIASMNRWIEGYSAAKQLAGTSRFEKVDESTVRIKLASSNITFPYALAGSTQMAIITKASECSKEDSAGYLVNTIGTGPYKLDKWELGQYITISKFDDYVPYGDSSKEIDGMAGYKNGYIKTINFYYVPDESTRVAGLQTGQYDFIYNVTSDDYNMISSVPGFTTFKDEAGTLTALFNKKQGIGTDQYFRQAVITALDMEKVLKSTYGDFYSLGSSYMDAAQGTWVNDAGSASYNQKNTAKAKELLAKSSYKGETVRLLTSNINGYPNGAEIIRQQLESIGIKVDVQIVEFATYSALSQDPTAYDIGMVSYSSVPIPSQKVYITSTYRGWASDEKLADMLSKFNSATTIDTAKNEWKDIQEYCYEYVPVIHFGHYQLACGYSTKVSGVVFYNANPYFWNAKVAQ